MRLIMFHKSTRTQVQTRTHTEKGPVLSNATQVVIFFSVLLSLLYYFTSVEDKCKSSLISSLPAVKDCEGSVQGRNVPIPFFFPFLVPIPVPGFEVPELLLSSNSK